MYCFSEYFYWIYLLLLLLLLLLHAICLIILLRIWPDSLYFLMVFSRFPSVFAAVDSCPQKKNYHFKEFFLNVPEVFPQIFHNVFLIPDVFCLVFIALLIFRFSIFRKSLFTQIIFLSDLFFAYFCKRCSRKSAKYSWVILALAWYFSNSLQILIF